MTKYVLCVLFACTPRHDVELQFGPDAESLTIGFRCYRDSPPDELMFQRAVALGLVRFAVVIDVITIDGPFPGCRGEDLVKACRDTGNCKVYTDKGRYCVDISVPLGDVPLGDPGATLEWLNNSLRERAPIIADDPPDGPVVVRAIATQETCTEIMSSPSFPLLSIDAALGCAYSCPTRLDDIDVPLVLSLDTLTDHCEQMVRQCAAFPGAP